jgi:hypothetical protein
VLVTSAGLDGASTSATLSSVCYDGGHVGLLQLNFWDVVEGRLLCSLGDGGEGFSGWLVEWGLILVRALG